jgi:hypothetical protein
MHLKTILPHMLMKTLMRLTCLFVRVIVFLTYYIIPPLHQLHIRGHRFLKHDTRQDLRAVVRFVHECFVFRSSLLVAAG